MPHCGVAMYNNLLWANWSIQDLCKVAILGNSFQSYMERLVTVESTFSPECYILFPVGHLTVNSKIKLLLYLRFTKQNHPCITIHNLQVMQYCHEKPLPPYKEPTVFNDLSLHTFPLEKLLLAPSAIWGPHPPPTHPSDPEMIT